MEEKTMEENSCGKSRGEDLEAEAPRRHPGGLREASRRDPGVPQEIPRRPPGSPQRHPQGTQRHPRCSQWTRGVFDVKLATTIMFYSSNGVSDHFCVDGSDVTFTAPAACAQKRAGLNEESYSRGKHPFPKYTARSPRQKLFGKQCSLNQVEDLLVCVVHLGHFKLKVCQRRIQRVAYGSGAER